MMKNYLKMFGLIAILLVASVSHAQYCTPTISPSATTYLNYVKINNGDVLNNTSANDGYKYTTDGNIILTTGSAYRFDLGVADPSVGEYKRVHIWVDTNQDGDFEDAGEELLNFTFENNTAANLGFSNKPVGTFENSGSSRMRIAFRSSNTAMPNPILPCDSFTEGEVEDFLVELQGLYCAPAVATSATSYVNYFKINDGALLDNTTGNDGYSYTPDSNIKLVTGNSYKFNFGVADPTAKAYKRIHVWVDKNNDGDFIDAGEEIFSWTGANTTADLGFSNKSIGVFSQSGNTRMRIAFGSSDAAMPNAMDPCGTYADAEIEDYSVIMQADYCTPALSPSTTSYISYFQIDNGAVLDNTSGNVGYEDHTGSNITLNSGGSYRFSFGTGNPAAGANKRVAIWIDKNQDNDFTDTDELVFSWTGAYTGVDAAFSNKPIGAFTLTGSTRMRIAMRSSDSPMPDEIGPCDTFTDGEIEDFSIVFPDPIPLLTAESESDVFVSDNIPYSTNGTPHTYRIPSIVTTNNGTLLAIADARYESAADIPALVDLHVRRSLDKGVSWGSPSPIVIPTGHGGDACTVIDKTNGRIFVFYAYSENSTIWTSNGDPNSPNCLRSRYLYSDDDGVTWSTPVDLTAALYKAGDSSYWASAGTGIQLRNGTLVIPIGVVRSGKIYGGLLYSTDHGATWNRSLTNSFDKFDENTLVELNDGRIMVNARNHYGNGTRAITYTSDLGATWSPVVFDSELTDPICQGNIMRYTSTLDGYDKNRILFSNASSTSSRTDGALRISYDEGQTWAYSKLYQTGSSAYSNIAILPDGKIGVFYESDNYAKIKFKKFSLEDLTDSTDSFTALGVEDVNGLNNGVSLYPNPVESILNVKTLGKAEVKIFNVLGKNVYVGSLNQGDKEVDLSNFKSGLYFVKIKNEMGISNFKIIKK